MSLANWEWLTSRTFVAILNPRRDPNILATSRFLLKGSTIIMYNKGDKGHPCRRPLEATEKGDGLPLMRGKIHGDPMQALIHKMKSLLKPNFQFKEQKGMIYPIKSVGHIQLNNRSNFSRLLTRMNNFLN